MPDAPYTESMNFVSRKLRLAFCLVGVMAVLLPSAGLLAGQAADSLKALEADKNFSAIDTIPGVAIDLRYASTNNFMQENLYGDFNRAYLHTIAAEKLKKAAAGLQKIKPGWTLLLYDGLRPRSVQWLLWKRVKGTDQQPYVANPKRGSIHNYGFAVDLTLQDAQGNEVDMGTPFDHFGKLAQPTLEKKFLKQGKLTQQQVKNRRLLRQVMENAGFIQLPLEWWHFDALPKKQVKSKYKIIE